MCWEGPSGCARIMFSRGLVRRVRLGRGPDEMVGMMSEEEVRVRRSLLRALVAERELCGGGTEVALVNGPDPADTCEEG